MTPTASRRQFLREIGTAAAIGLIARGGQAASPEANPRPAKKYLSVLRARAKDGHVTISAYKTTPAFQDKAAEKHFRAIRIYRRDEPAFTLGKDYAEYFDALSYKKAELIFEGPLKPTNDRKFTYVDRAAKIGTTYSYWMAADDGEPTGPVGVKVRDPDVWWSCQRVQREIRKLKDMKPGLVTIETIGHSVRGRALEAIRLGKGKRTVGMIGAVHAGESGPELMLPAFGKILANHSDLLAKVSISAVPIMNPDERQRLVDGVPWYLRTNANGVDLNRNFPADWKTIDYAYGLDTSDPDSATYRGPKPASEPETRAVMAYLRAQRVEVVYAFHCLASICGARFLGPKCASGDQDYAAKCRSFAATYGTGMLPTLPKGKALGFGTSAGSLPTWCYRELGVPAFDLEISQFEKQTLAKCRLDQTDRPLLAEYQTRHTKGILAVLRAMIE